MSARRQPSTTSLSKYVRASTPDLQPRSLDFCNAFWGLGDGGVDVLFARMRGAARTVEELKNFWKERAAIEEDYAKRLTKLSKMVLGRDEIGELRNSMNAVKVETERQSGFHLSLAQQIRNDLESPAAAFYTRQLQHKKVAQAAIEKDFKTKQTQETYVTKAREKYEADCMRINSYTAQSSLVQGKDLEKIHIKLERAQQTVQTNERDFANFSKALQDTVHKWEQAWKVFCDQCQDLEEERMEFMRDNMWAYANCVSTVCVADDESCEKMRLALERMEAEKDMENFVHNYGTGNQIPDPPAFVNYNTSDAVPSSSSRPTFRPAQFVRATQRELPLRNTVEPDLDEPVVNTAGIGAGGGGRRSELYTEPPDLTRRPTQSRAQAQQAVYVNGTHNNQPAYGAPAPGPTGQPPQRKPTYASQAPSQTSQRILQDPHAETIDPTAETYIKVGNNAYKVDLSKDPQQQGRIKAPSPSIRSNASSPVKPIGNGSTTVDPLAKQLEELQNAVSSTGSVRRNTVNRPSMAAQAQEQRPSSRPRTSPGPSTTLSPPPTSTSLAGGSNLQSTSPAPVRDYRNSAEVVVGTHPAAAAAASRPASPNPPTAAFMVPRPTTPSGSEVVQEVLADYHQSLPGERKSLSRQGSRRGSFSVQPGQQNPPQHQSNLSHGQNLARPPSTGHAGIGAHGSRSNSPQPQSRGPSPAPGSVMNSYIAPPPQGIVRAPSPNAVGIVLDPSGRVLHDDMAHGYQQQQQHQQRPQQQQQQRPGPPQQQQIQPQYNPPIVPQQQQPQARRSSYMSVPPPQQQAYAVTPPPPTLYQAPPPQASYIQPPPPVQPSYTPSPVLYQPAPVPQQQQTAYQMTPAQAGSYSAGVNGVGVGRGAPGYYQPQQQQLAPVQQQQQLAPVQQQQQQRQLQPQQRLQQPQQQQQLQPQQQQLQPQQQQRQGGYQPQQQQQQLGYRDPSPVGRSPSPQPPPPGQTTEDGDQILFYVKALYEYAATIEEEFDFQAGDIIAVTSTPEDGWWNGELLDEARRQPGRNVFPSNFVCLF
ncbi:uncharacterized protein LACBIDRAFT_316391 [Laccaria bicolor S238N-H82]|uniref:Predicted protein n=1 Tax=Laccaria bicolor (strain S238N-H82 / ATCC MYA-4686) TaxID=486041 RepID=B0E0U9_LACBS|nr:uncharacterized protein LACBIDRAFT_316391 [Laccaria bicolor S238N-H82]EDQ99507.1 predicted protein [Laccaria bicolor S238N-H82]|eukprot:XP_001889856.1 predicted protein [Laccaria bicolor S238N-H82]